MTINEVGEYVSLKEAAALTGLSHARILQMVRGYKDIDERRGLTREYPPIVPGKKIGRDWFIKREHLHLITSRRRAGWEKGKPRKSP